MFWTYGEYWDTVYCTALEFKIQKKKNKKNKDLIGFQLAVLKIISYETHSEASKFGIWKTGLNFRPLLLVW